VGIAEIRMLQWVGASGLEESKQLEAENMLGSK
jgi:hypothetical protein